MEPEQILTEFMRRHYSDDKLAELLAHAEDGKLSFYSCCCFIGVSTADHPLRVFGEYVDINDPDITEDHYHRAYALPNSSVAEGAYARLSGDEEDALKGDEIRRAKLIPLIKAEISRRESSRSQTEVSEMVMV